MGQKCTKSSSERTNTQATNVTDPAAVSQQEQHRVNSSAVGAKRAAGDQVVHARSRDRRRPSAGTTRASSPSLSANSSESRTPSPRAFVHTKRGGGDADDNDSDADDGDLGGIVGAGGASYLDPPTLDTTDTTDATLLATDESELDVLASAFNMTSSQLSSLYALFAAKSTDGLSLDLASITSLISATSPFAGVGDCSTLLTHLLVVSCDFDPSVHTRLSFAQYVNVIATLCLFSREELVGLLFDAYDADMDGVLQPSEVDGVAALTESVSELPDEVCAQAIAFDEECAVLRHECSGSTSDASGRWPLPISRDDFSELVSDYPHLVWSVFRLQSSVQEATLGVSDWFALRGLRRYDETLTFASAAASSSASRSHSKRRAHQSKQRRRQPGKTVSPRHVDRANKENHREVSRSRQAHAGLEERKVSGRGSSRQDGSVLRIATPVSLGTAKVDAQQRRAEAGRASSSSSSSLSSSSLWRRRKQKQLSCDAT